MTSQSKIEEILTTNFPNGGKFLEIGCWQGEHISQTAYLESIGWTGICVDPFPYFFEGRKAKLIEAAISKDGLPREFIKVSIDRRYGGDVSYFSGFKDSIKDHWALISEHCDYEQLTIPTIKFDDLGLDSYTEFLSVDTEGSELEILKSINQKKYSFGFIMVEHNQDQKKRKKIQALLKKYVLYKELPIDDIYINLNLK